MMDSKINLLAELIEDQGRELTVNLDRPVYIQPEDSLVYRASRIVLICGLLNKSTGLSKEIVACVDFLLRNPGYQRKFILEYFKGKRNLIKKLEMYDPKSNVESDYHIIQYRSVPWDIRFNDMFLFLFVRKLISFRGEKPNTRVLLSKEGTQYLSKLVDVFIDEVNFLEIFGKTIYESKAIQIITEVIPNSYWKENEKLDYK